MLIAGIILIVLSTLLNIIQTSFDIKTKGKIEIVRFVLTSIVTVLGGFFTFYNIPLSAPIIRVNEEQTGVLFLPSNIGTTIEYSLQEDDIKGPVWKKYDEGTIIPVVEDPTEIWFRSKLLWRFSDEVYQMIHLNEYGQVYLRIQPKVPIESIRASYNEREESVGIPSNTYAGYVISEKDITVVGEGLEENNEEMELDGFSFSPSKLKEGENDIDVQYITSGGQELHCFLTVFAHAPNLISLNANLKREFTENVLPTGTVLDTSMFDVTGKYENGEKKAITDFQISPIELNDENEYSVAISKNGIEDVVNISVVNPENISEVEKDINGANDDIGGANEIIPNARYKGHLEDEDDVDYYRLKIKEKGSIRIKFEHDKIDNTSTFWVISLLSKDESNPIIKAKSEGASVQIESSTVRLNPGVYYIRIERGVYSEKQYTFSVDYTKDSEYIESEPNDEIQEATEILTNTEELYTGNLQTEEDYDYYKFDISQKGKIYIQFNHTKKDSNNTYWVVSVLDDTDETITSLKSQGNESTRVSDCFRVPEGEYYIRVKRGIWSDIDYRIGVYYLEEGDEAESEPNGDFDKAGSIDLNQDIVGNIQSEEDEDFYILNHQTRGDINLRFIHERSDSNNTFWVINMFSETSSEALAIEDGDNYVRVKGNDPKEINARWKDLKEGIYYLKVSRGIYDNRDYHIVISE